MGFERTEASEPVKLRLSLSLSKTVDSPSVKARLPLAACERECGPLQNRLIRLEFTGQVETIDEGRLLSTCPHSIDAWFKGLYPVDHALVVAYGSTPHRLN